MASLALRAALRPARRLALGTRGIGFKVMGDRDNFKVTKEMVDAFHRDGYLVLRGFLSESELRPIEAIYDKIMRREIAIPGKDMCDMSKGFDTKFEDFSIVNAMLPRRYHPPLAGNCYERRGQKVAQQLYGGTEMAYDYDQFLDKRPRKADAVFAWHQDMAYWPPTSLTPDTRTATFSLALDATRVANGCLKFIPGSHKAKVVRPHVPIGSTREDAHAIAIKVDEAAEKVVYVEIDRGDVSIHDEYVVHGSAGNGTDGHRRTYVCAFRTADCVARERAVGFDHSHNTNVNWDTLNKWGADGGKK